ncbi:hypothetical protein HOK96_02600 [bacterium]|jgi:hypothetical protein|nr:hypothetical protein [bacterium]MBT3903740.1 hypothetical protein [bacterium]MBT4577910.1 hypothetical protein [bacterium]MBT5345907.1 hypothetical protein [bacterium]MBT6131123.1 hypothetical protein [bacterium]
MRFTRLEWCGSENKGYYWPLKDSEDNVDYLWQFLHRIGSSHGTLLKIIGKEDISGTAIFTVEANVYISSECDDLRWQQRIVLKDDPRYLFKTTRQGFVDLIKQWIKVHKLYPPGISIEEVSTDVWQVRPMTQEDVERCKLSR